MKKINFKMKFLCLAMCLSLVIGIFPVGLTLPKVMAYTPTESIIEGGDFTTTSDDFPASSSNWDDAGGSLSTSNLKSGIISTNTSTFTANQDAYGLGALPNSITDPNNYVYMINNGLNSTRAGIVSEEFTLDANSHYIISVDVATSLPVFSSRATTEVESVASVYLTGGDINESFTAINTNKNWRTYNFYISTDNFSSTTVTLELWLGIKNLQSSVGAVLFDNARALKYDNNEFFTRLNSQNFTNTNSKYGNYSLTAIDDMVTNASFEDVSLTGWTASYNPNSPMSQVFDGVTTLDQNFDSATVGNLSNPGTNLKYNNINALYINNTEKAGVAYTSDWLTIERQTYYKLSVYVKTQNITENGASVSIVPENEDLSAVTFEDIQTTVTTNSITNNWTKYTFYILGSPFQNERISIKLALGDVDATEDLENNLVKGAVFFDDIEVYSINYNQYTNASEDSYTKKVQLYTDGTASTITNAFFNLADANYEGVYPLAPASWTINNDNTNSGIISTNKDHFNTHSSNYGYISLEDIGFTRLQYDQSDKADNNLLMIYNPNADFTTYTSASYSMSDNTYYKLTIDSKTLTNGNAYIEIVNDSTTLAEFTFSSNEAWSTYTIYFYNTYGSKNIQVVLGLGTESENSDGYAFFDNVIMETIEADEFEGATANSNTKVIDLSKEEFTLISSETDGIYTRPYNWTIEVENEDLIDAGVLVGDTNKLVISSIQNDTDVRFTSNFTYTLDTANFYTLTFRVYVEGLTDLEDSGIIIGLSDTDYKFEKITNNEESEFIFYISGEVQSTINPYFGLVTKGANTAVNAYLSSLELETISEVDFNNMKTSIDEEAEDAPTNVIVIGTTKSEEEDTTTTPVGGNSFDWILLPSLIIGLALIIAIVGVIIRRTKFKKISRTKVANYDRTRTLHPEVVRRQAEEERRRKLQAIEEELLRNQQELEEYEKAYKQKRELAMAQKQEKKAQAEFKAYAKGRSKLAKKQEQLLAEKETVSSDEYLAEKEEQILREYESNNNSPISETKESQPVEKSQNDNIDIEETTAQNDEVEIINPDDIKDEDKK